MEKKVISIIFPKNNEFKIFKNQQNFQNYL